MTLHQAIETAKAKAAGNAKWIRAIERAASGLLDNTICVTLFCDGYALVTTPTGQHRVNGRCSCQAAQHGHTQCVHRAAKRLVEMMEETAPVAVSEPVATNSDNGATSRYCGDRDLQHLDRCAPHFRSDVAASSRANLIAEIKNIWPRVETTPLAVELMARFRVNKLEFLDDDQLRRVRLAIAM